MRKSASFRHIHVALNKLYEKLSRENRHGSPPLFGVDTESDSSRYIILSDLHRGKRDRADDFRHSERAFNASLAWYYELGYTLVILGDAEELWQEHPGKVTQAYHHSLELEAKFHRKNRYIRIWGNHDDEWESSLQVKRYLAPIFGPDLAVHEAVLLPVIQDSKEIGQLFLVHGHQGSREGDRWGKIARGMVRLLYRPFQRISGFSHSTPADSWELREGHNKALNDWTSEHPGVILIAGHTHRPVFASQTHPDQIKSEIEKLRQKNAEPHRIAELSAELEWVRAQEEKQKSGKEGSGSGQKQLRYFNTGCCCYTDGQITGLEITGDDIRLVRWPDKNHLPRSQVLAPEGDRKMSLSSLLE
ncbi:metallophosphoesterase [Spirochaeta dissipatitropha]